jgi:hypothetical protein
LDLTKRVEEKLTLAGKLWRESMSYPINNGAG